jgi:hypothetical protein
MIVLGDVIIITKRIQVLVMLKQEKTKFVHDYQLMLFGILLIILTKLGIDLNGLLL